MKPQISGLLFFPSLLLFFSCDSPKGWNYMVCGCLTASPVNYTTEFFLFLSPVVFFSLFLSQLFSSVPPTIPVTVLLGTVVELWMVLSSREPGFVWLTCLRLTACTRPLGLVVRKAMLICHTVFGQLSCSEGHSVEETISFIIFRDVWIVLLV